MVSTIGGSEVSSSLLDSSTCSSRSDKDFRSKCSAYLRAVCLSGKTSRRILVIRAGCISSCLVCVSMVDPPGEVAGGGCLRRWIFWDILERMSLSPEIGLFVAFLNQFNLVIGGFHSIYIARKQYQTH